MGLFVRCPPLWGGGFSFLSFGFAKREERNKGEKSESRGISIFPLDNPLLKTTTQGAAAPYVENPRWGASVVVVATLGRERKFSACGKLPEPLPLKRLSPWGPFEWLRLRRNWIPRLSGELWAPTNSSAAPYGVAEGADVGVGRQITDAAADDV